VKSEIKFLVISGHVFVISEADGGDKGIVVNVDMVLLVVSVAEQPYRKVIV
jgi:hypothetical protein